MVFCNAFKGGEKLGNKIVTILILVDGFLQYGMDDVVIADALVTILILVDGFLQFINDNIVYDKKHKSQSLF